MGQSNIVAKEIMEFVRNGYEKSVAALAFMVKQHLNIENLEILSVHSEEDLSFTVDSQISVLTTEIIGDTKGKSYLFLSEKDAAELFKLTTGQEPNNQEFLEAVLKETDNIVSAAFISVIADKYKLKIYGDVPYYFLMSKDEVNNQYNKDINNFGKAMILVKAVLTSDDGAINVGFDWMIDPTLIE
ncbi:MAG: hypothetical protein OEY34_05350 [Cyclobacteriaceae bacterium]|nr:hypothetical protein [Cyclobacteriaceae bacterium]